jgi:hypothetical protein
MSRSEFMLINDQGEEKFLKKDEVKNKLLKMSIKTCHNIFI